MRDNYYNLMRAILGDSETQPKGNPKDGYAPELLEQEMNKLNNMVILGGTKGKGNVAHIQGHEQKVDLMRDMGIERESFNTYHYM